MAQIEITIKGAPGAGKTTIAYIVERALREYNLDTEVVDLDLSVENRRDFVGQHIARLAGAVRDKETTVKVVTQQLQKDAVLSQKD